MREGEFSSADTMMGGCVFLSYVPTQDSSGRTMTTSLRQRRPSQRWKSLYSGREGQRSDCCTPLHSPLLMSLNNLQNLLLPSPPSPFFIPLLPPSLVCLFSMGKLLEEVMGRKSREEGLCNNRRSMAMSDKGYKHAN